MKKLPWHPFHFISPYLSQMVPYEEPGPPNGFSRSEKPIGQIGPHPARGIIKPAGEVGQGQWTFIIIFNKRKIIKSLNLPFVSNRNKRGKKKRKRRERSTYRQLPSLVTQNRAVLGNLTPCCIQLMHSRTARCLPDASPSPNCPWEKPSLSLCWKASLFGFPFQISISWDWTPSHPSAGLFNVQMPWQQPDLPAGLWPCNSIQNLGAGARIAVETSFMLQERRLKKKYIAELLQKVL